MPDARKHRGQDHADAVLFGESKVHSLKESVTDLSWLLGRGYSEPGAVKLVGDRWRLRRRQREAVVRSSCSAASALGRRGRMLAQGDLRGRRLRVDGFNVIITVEAAISGAFLFLGRDGCLRDIASVHGSYRQVDETRRAVTLTGSVMERAGIADALWLFDSPVANSGRLRRLVQDIAEQRGWNWQVDLEKDPDGRLLEPGDPVATSDSRVLEACGDWVNLARATVEAELPDARIIDLG